MDKASATPRKIFTAERQRMSRDGGAGAARALPAAGKGLRGGASAAAGAPMVHVDTSELMHEMRSMKDELRALDHMLRAQFEPTDKVDEQAPEDDPILREYERQKLEVNILKTELRALANSIQETKREIAQLRTNNQESDRLIAVAGELDAIVGSTERATDGILDAAEKIDTIAHNLKAHGGDNYATQLAEDLTEAVLVIFEHCNFQDITGQRTTKVVNTLKFVEERIDKMIDIWGRDAFEELLGEDAEREDDARLLNGPALGDAGISQNEIDKLFD
jgi:chemotaxis protein CheZ